MRAHVSWQQDLLFSAQTENGHNIEMDGNQGASAPSPMEIVERFFAKLVTGQMENPVTPIVKGEGKKAACCLKRPVKTKTCNIFEENLGVACTPPLHTLTTFKMTAKRFVVVYFAVKADYQP